MADHRPIRPAFVAALILAGALGLTACGKGGPAAHAPERGDQAVAKVGDDTIWASDVKREAVAQGLIGEGEPLEVSSEQFHRVLDEGHSVFAALGAVLGGPIRWCVVSG